MASRLVPLRLWSATALGTDAVLTTGPIDCRNQDPEVLMFRAASVAGTADVKLQYKISNDGITFNSIDSQADLVSTTVTEFTGANPEEYHALNIPLAPWIELVVTEISAANLSDTLIDGTLWMREL